MYFHVRCNELMTFQGQQNGSIIKDQLKPPIFPFLEVVFEKFVDTHL